METTESLTIICYEDSITQLHIIGSTKVPLLFQNFSIDSFFTTLVKLPGLKVITLVSLGLWGNLPPKISRLSSLEILNMSSNFFFGGIPREISSLKNLQTLILDDNMFDGRVPNWFFSLPVLTVLSLRKNSLNGSLPNSLGSLENLRVLSLSHNQLFGKVPDLSKLENLQVLDLENNSLGPQFPLINNKLVTLTLRKNKFNSAIPDEISSYYQLQHLDLSFNRFVGPFPPALLSLPSITSLNIAGNRFTGKLFENLSCNPELGFVDLSSNLLSGFLPECLLKQDNKDKVVLYGGNCLGNVDGNQHPVSFCHNEALAVGILPRSRNKSKGGFKAVIIVGIIGGIFGGFVLVGLIFFVLRKVNQKKRSKTPPTRLIAENVSTHGYTSKLLSDARYISQTMKLGALGLPAYRTFSLEELEEATGNFDTYTFMGEGSHGQMYRGQLKDGSFVAIRCLKMKRSHSTQNFTHHVELISKLRHRHLVSALGHCFECYLDDSSVSRVFLVFEYVPNGTLRAFVSGGRQTLTWVQRIAAAIGVAKGIQFLHTGIVPGVFSNNLKITDILLDQNLVAKISSYNLPLLAENMKKVGSGCSSSGSKELSHAMRMKHGDKMDVYDFGVILLEIITGRQLNSENEVNTLKDQLEASVTSDDLSRRRMVDRAARKGCSDESLKTMMEICISCLLKDPSNRPSVEDVLWNLQFASQVQLESNSSDSSPVSRPQPPPLQLIYHEPNNQRHDTNEDKGKQHN